MAIEQRHSSAGGSGVGRRCGRGPDHADDNSRGELRDHIQRVDHVELLWRIPAAERQDGSSQPGCSLYSKTRQLAIMAMQGTGSSWDHSTPGS